MSDKNTSYRLFCAENKIIKIKNGKVYPFYQTQNGLHNTSPAISKAHMSDLTSSEMTAPGAVSLAPQISPLIEKYLQIKQRKNFF